MTETALRFGELVAGARTLGFELYDANHMPVREELQPAFEDDNLTAKPVQVGFHEHEGGAERGVVADVTVGQYVFHLYGDWCRAAELRHMVRGTADDGTEPL